MERAWEHLRRGDYAAAHQEAGELCAQYPAHRDVLYLLAVSLRGLGRTAEALAVLDQLAGHHPRYARAFEERGLCQLARGAMEPAIAAFSSAVRLNTWLSVSWSALAALYRKCGRTQEADAAARSCAILERLPSEIRIAYSLFGDGDIHAAEQRVRHYLLTRGDDIEGLRLLALIAMAHDAPDGALTLLEKLLAIAPDYHAARYEYAIALLRRLKHRRAREELEKLLAIAPENRAYRFTHATVCTRLGEFERALPAYQRLLKETPKDAELHMALGHSLKTLGRTAEAIDSYHAAAALRPGYGGAYWNLANLKTYRFDAAELERMSRYEADAATSRVDRYHLCFALGKALEDRGEYARSFHYYERGNALKKEECRYRPEFLETIARLQRATCTADFFAARRGWGHPDAAPIFIVGLPRAGSTLIEQILASHSAVDGTMELPDIAHLVFDLHDRTRPPDSPSYPGVLAELDRQECARLGEQYLRETGVYRHGRRFFIDKWPSNFRDLGFIHLILPNARIIDARREPMACCFSNFKQLFPAGAGPEFVYSFEDIARYYRMYLTLMRHWDAVLPGKILRIQHEELVTDFPATVQRILEFCDLEPEPACFEFHKTERAIHTPSAEQVRRPINRAGLDHWRHFEPWLAPLREALVRFEVMSPDTPACGR
ncbi:MAG: tetratricopeptide repeat-containing sulfotransferase family protein [Steroidobacteraceae bacterium]